MYRSRLTIFAAIAGAIILGLPAANLAAIANFDRLPRPDAPRDWWSVDRIEGSLAYVLASCCQMSMRPDRVQIGQDGYLFLGDEHSDVMSKTTGQVQASAEAVDAAVAWLVRFRQLALAAGAAPVIAIAPNKHSVYSEKLPSDLRPAARTVMDDLLDGAAASGLAVLDMRPPLRQLKSSAQVYYRTDTHWTHAGAALSYDLIMAELRAVSGVAAVDVTYKLSPARHPAGDLAVLLKMQEMLGPDHDADYRIRFDTPPRTCLAPVASEGGEEGECTPVSKNVSVTHDGDVQVSRTSNAPNLQTVLLLCDSFCTASSRLFDASFRTVYRVHWKYTDAQLLETLLATLQPDIAILQVVERDLLQLADITSGGAGNP
jgi:alginate O-acetyltransferase complex protein AlgJ